MDNFLTMSRSLQGPFEGQIALIIKYSIYLSTKIKLKYDHCDSKSVEIILISFFVIYRVRTNKKIRGWIFSIIKGHFNGFLWSNDPKNRNLNIYSHKFKLEIWPFCWIFTEIYIFFNILSCICMEWVHHNIWN